MTLLFNKACNQSLEWMCSKSFLSWEKNQHFLILLPLFPQQEREAEQYDVGKLLLLCILLLSTAVLQDDVALEVVAQG